MKQYTSHIVIGIITLLSLSLIVFFAPKNQVSSKTNREVALMCTTDMATQFHIHPILEIVINGKKQEIPEDIGIKPTCMNSIHTHDNSGTIHVESPEKRDFTLSDFFAVWNKTYNKNQIFDYKVDNNHLIKQTINGKEVIDYDSTILYDEDKIVISYEERK